MHGSGFNSSSSLNHTTGKTRLHNLLHSFSQSYLRIQMEMNNNIAGINVKLPIYHLHTQGGEDQAQNIEKEVSATDILQELMITSCRSKKKKKKWIIHVTSTKIIVQYYFGFNPSFSFPYLQSFIPKLYAKM